jgi:hypothetical protein
MQLRSPVGLDALLRQHLRSRPNISIEGTACFGDLLWAIDDAAEVLALEPATIVDDSTGRRVVLQPVRRVFRYFLTNDRAPTAINPQLELGVLKSTTEALSLCGEFLVGGAVIATLRTPRTART